MRKIFLFSILILCLITVGCTKPTKPKICDDKFTVSGRYYDGQTMRPLGGQNIELDWKGRYGGDSILSHATSFYTDGSYSMTYPCISNGQLSLIVYHNADIYAVDTIPRRQNVTKDYYYSTQGWLKLNVNPLSP